MDSLKSEIAAIDSELDGKKFLFGDHVTIADFFIFSVFLTLDEMTDVEIGGENIPMFMNRIKGLLFSRGITKLTHIMGDDNARGDLSLEEDRDE